MALADIILISTITGLATAVGGLLGCLFPVRRDGRLAYVLGFAGGVMLGLSMFCLLPQAFYFSGSRLLSVWGLLGGLLLMLLLANIFGRDDGAGDYRRMGIFIAIGIALHNLPEGVALGVGFQSSAAIGFMVATSLLLHNIPEGIAIGAPLGRGGRSLWRVLVLTTLAGLMTPLGAAAGWLLGEVSYDTMALAMGFAAGAMIYICCHELFYVGLKLRRGWCECGIFCGVIITYLLG